MSPLALLLLFACAEPEEPVDGCVWPEEATPPSGTVTESCGWFELEIGQHLYVSVYVTETETPCTLDLGAGLEARDPIYSHMADDEPKWTYDFLAQVPGPDQPIDIACEDGTVWQAKVDVK